VLNTYDATEKLKTYAAYLGALPDRQAPGNFYRPPFVLSMEIHGILLHTRTVSNMERRCEVLSVATIKSESHYSSIKEPLL
jgi:hypothetical protein